MTGVELRSAADRLVTPTDWGESRHSFSFGGHYDSTNTSFGLLVACNEELLPPGAGFDDHPHAGVEIVTWVLDGTLEHVDSTGRRGTVGPGVVQRTSAGSGVVHAERNAGDTPVRFVQSWVLSARPGDEPDHEQRAVGDRLTRGALVPVVSGRGHPGATSLRQPDAVLHVALLGARDSVTLPAAPYVHALVARGGVELPGWGALDEGGAARVTDRGDVIVTATTAPAELLVWEMHAAV